MMSSYVWAADADQVGRMFHSVHNDRYWEEHVSINRWSFPFTLAHARTRGSRTVRPAQGRAANQTPSHGSAENTKVNNAMPIPKRACQESWRSKLLPLSLILYQFDDDMAFVVVRVLHAELDRPLCGRQPLQPKTIDTSSQANRWIGGGGIASTAIVQHLDIFTRNDLFHASVHCISDFDKVVIEEDEVLSIKTSRLGATDKFHHHAS